MILLFKFHRTDVSEGGMTTNAIVKTLQVFKDGLPGFLPRGEPHAINALPFERAKKAFHGGIVVTVACSAHADQDASLQESALISMTGVGAALVRVQEHFGRRITTKQSHL